MVVYKKLNKSWGYRHKYKNVFTGEKDELKKQGFRTKAEAQAHFKEAIKNKDEGYDINPDITVVEYLNQWMRDYKEGHVAKNTYRQHQRNIDNHIASYFKNMKLEQLSHPGYQKFINHLLNKVSVKTKEPLSKRTVEIIHTTMYGALYRAKINKIIIDNPAEGALIYNSKEIVEKRNPNRDLQFIPYDMIEPFLDAAIKDNYTYYMFFRFLIESGVRKGEASSLTWSHIDVENRIITIDQSIDYEAKTDDELFSNTKTYRSIRQFKTTSRMIQLLNAHKVRQEDNKARFQDAYKHHLDLVFCREDGSPIPKSTLFNAFRRILKKRGYLLLKFILCVILLQY